MKLFVFFTFIVFSKFSFSQSIGFKNGNHIEITNLQGTVRVHCQQPGGYQQTQTISCTTQSTNPGSHDYFIHPNKEATDLQIIAVHEDGSKHEKNGKFDKEKGRSKSRFNLTTRTLTQTPLLKSGKNEITYFLKKQNSIIETGSFIADVQILQDRICPFDVLHTNYYSCTDKARICSDYFWLNNACE